MTAYIDLSVIVFVFNYVLSFIYSYILFNNIKNKKYFVIQSLCLSIFFAVINLFLIPYFFIMATIIYSLILFLIDKRYFKIIISSLIIYYINNAFLLLIGGCYLYDGILLISIPFVTFFILLEPVYICIIHIISNHVYSAIKYHKFKIKCIITLNNSIYKGHGYYDSGNSLLYNEIPVIFIKGKSLYNNGKLIKIKGINDYEFSYLAYKGNIVIKNKCKSVYIVFVSEKLNFYNCKFLLNKYLL